MQVREAYEAFVINGLTADDRRLQLLTLNGHGGELPDKGFLRFSKRLGSAKVIGETHAQVTIAATQCAPVVHAFEQPRSIRNRGTIAV